MFTYLVRFYNHIQFNRKRIRNFFRVQFLKAIGKDPEFNPDKLVWNIGPFSATSEKMRQTCLRLMMGKLVFGEMRSPKMAPTESSFEFDADSTEGSEIYVNTEEFGTTTAMKFQGGKWVLCNYAGCPECIISANELPFVNKEPTKLHDAYTGAYETKTKPILAMMRRYYEDNVYCFRNVKYRADELQSVIIGFALGRLPLGMFKYSEGKGYNSIVPQHPVDGAEIVTMPNYETFAVYKNGMWELNIDISINEPNCIHVNSRMLPFIAGIRTVTYCYETSYDAPVSSKSPAKLAVSFGVGYNPTSVSHYQNI
ncbi:MAG: hypothetical protein IJZ68_06135 [Bacteroidaceae bacterium]|nr:hypothetical protein [Bacteroidaceae bacterium]